MTRLATPDAPLVWEAVSAALTRRPQKPTEAVRDRDLDLRTTRELVGLLNAEDATVAGAVAEAGDALAAAIDAIAERLARGGRLIYVGAGTSGRLAALDAAECGPTFGSRPGEVVAVVAGDDGGRRGRSRRAASPIWRARRRRATTSSSVSARAARRRTRSPRSRLRARRARCASRLHACAAASSPMLAEHEIAVVDRARGGRRIDAAQGGNRTEARAEHDLDGDDGAPRADVRRLDGRRRRRRTRSCASVRAAIS